MNISTLVPHQGAMCLLARVESWTPDTIICQADSHLAAANPLRKNNRLNMLCGCEYGFQAAALHGALLSRGVAQRPGFLAALRVSLIASPYLDDPGIGTLRVEAIREASQPNGLVYGFRLEAEDGRLLLEGRGTIALPAA